MIVARQSTARTMMVGPVLDADGVAVTTAVVGNFKISKNGGAPAALDASATLTHRNTGQYSLALTANDLDTVGQAEVVIDATVNASPIKEISVLEEAVYDSIFAAGATGYQVPIWSSAGATVNLSATTISAVSGAVGSVTGAVGSVTGAVGSVTGNVGGNVVGSVASVTGNVGGNVTGSVGSVATGGITAASIATGAIDADALATDAISEIADGVWDEPLAAHTTADTPGNVLNMLTQDTVTLSTDVSLNSIIGQLLDAGTTWTYDRTTDSLEANRDNTGTAGAGLTAIDLPDQTMNITGNITGNLSGSVGSVTGAVGSVTAGVTVTTNNDKTGYSLTATTGLGNQTANITGNLSGSVGSVTGAVGSVTGAVGSVTGNIGGNVVGSVASVTGDIGGLAAGAITDVEDAVWDAVLASHLDAGSTGFALNAAGSAGDPWGTALPGAYGAGTAGFIIGTNLDALISSRMASYTQPTGFLAATFPSTVASTTNITAGTITTVSGNVNGSVGSVTGAVGSVTGTVTANVTQWNGSAVATPTVAGVPEVDVTHWIGTAPSSPDTPGIPMVQVLVPGGLVAVGNDYNTGTLAMNIVGDLSGSVGSVTGTVGSVTGSVGSVTGSVGSVAANGITDTSLAASAGTEIGTAVWASATRTLTAGTNIGTVQAQLIDGSHGGLASTLTLQNMNVFNSTGNAVVFESGPGFDGLQISTTAGDAIHLIGNLGNEQLINLTGSLTTFRNAIVGAPTGASVSADIADLPTASENASAVWAFVCEGAITAVEILRGILSFIGGQTLGGNTTNPRFRDQANTKNRIDMTVDSAGNRTATTLDLN